MPSLVLFYRVYQLEIQSVMLVFSTGFVNFCPSNLLSGQLSPPTPLPSVNKYTVYTYTLCKGGEYGVIGGKGGLKQIKHLPQSPFTGQFFRQRHLALLSISLIFLRLQVSLPVAGCDIPVQLWTFPRLHSLFPCHSVPVLRGRQRQEKQLDAISFFCYSEIYFVSVPVSFVLFCIYTLVASSCKLCLFIFWQFGFAFQKVLISNQNAYSYFVGQQSVYVQVRAVYLLQQFICGV